MTNQTNNKTKKELIRQMLAEGIEPMQISDRLNTSIEYVYKEKGKLKKEGLLVTQQSLSISDGLHDISVLKDESSLSRRTSYKRSNLSSYEMGEYDIPPLGEDKLKSMYSAFENGKGPIFVTSELGVHPAISEKEHDRVLKMKSRDPMELQKQLVSMIFNPTPPQIQSIIDKSAKELLTNDELIKLVNFKVESYAYWKFISAFSNPSVEIPSPLERPVCNACRAPQPGVIYDRATDRGYHTEKIISNAPCPLCQGAANSANRNV